jgi:acyl carrier protein
VTWRDLHFATSVTRSAVGNRLGVEPDALDAADDLREALCLDAIDLIAVVMRIEESLGIELSFAELGRITTVGDLVALVAQTRTRRAAREPPYPTAN